MADPDRDAPIDRRRYRRVVRFAFGVLLHAIWWDLLLNRPLLRRLRPPALQRWRRIARRYRDLAAELGGVLIKLGQFLSTRVDVIPLEVARELSALQDEVPPTPFKAIRERLESDLPATLDDLFSALEEAPCGSASLAQVHRARTVAGQRVVVKVLRPGIEQLVATDLAAFAVAIRWLRWSRRLRRRVDVDWIAREFRTVTLRELDLAAEGRSAERFAADFAGNPRVLVPEVYWKLSAGAVLTMADVAGLKISDRAALVAAGVDPAEVARTLYGIYMRQLFETHFVHADPHPGNIFVHPRQATGDGAADFVLAFVDFGMMTEIPERLRASLREFAIALGTRDARRLVESYISAGTLLPEADVERLVEAHRAVLDRFWGIQLAELRDAALDLGSQLALEYRDLLLEAPVQLQADMLFALRAVGLLAGLCTQLDEGFDPWRETVPYARRFAREDRGQWLEGLGSLAQSLLRLPAAVDRLLDRAERGALGVRTTRSQEERLAAARHTAATDRLGWNVAAGALVVAGAVVRAGGAADPAASWLFAAAAVAFAIGLLVRGRGRAGSR